MEFVKKAHELFFSGLWWQLGLASRGGARAGRGLRSLRPPGVFDWHHLLLIYVTNIGWELTSLFVCLLLDFINLFSAMSEDLNTLHTLWRQKIKKLYISKFSKYFFYMLVFFRSHSRPSPRTWTSRLSGTWILLVWPFDHLTIWSIGQLGFLTKCVDSSSRSGLGI